MRLATLQATVVRPAGAEKAPPALLLHGMGLGAWIWERTQRRLAEEGVASYAVDLPGHGADRSDPTVGEVADAVVAAAKELGTVAVVGHSFGGYVAQLVAPRVSLHGLVLVNAMPHGGIPYLPTRTGLRVALRYGAALASGRALTIGWDDYHRTGLDLCPETLSRGYYDRITPWPNRLTRSCLVRSRPDKVTAPVLSMIGRRDLVVRWQVGRRLGMWYDALIWRYDDLGHLPMLQEEGQRLERDLAGWLVAPKRRREAKVDLGIKAAVAR